MDKKTSNEESGTESQPSGSEMVGESEAKLLQKDREAGEDVAEYTQKRIQV